MKSTLMENSAQVAETTEALISATQDPRQKQIVFRGRLANVPTLRLLPGVSLRGDGEQAEIEFAEGLDGLQLSSNNRVLHLRLNASPTNRAIFNDTGTRDFGEIEIRDVTTTGRVQILARNAVQTGHVEINGLDIQSADARRETERPRGYGVSVLQGAFTLWNMQPDDRVVITANIKGLSAGRLGKPVLGSGIFIGGAGEKGGRLAVQRLETGAVFSDGRIAPGTPDQIAGGVFTIDGASVEVVKNGGSVTTYGPNDMALDNWGKVDRWLAQEKITTRGPSGIGFVNFGAIDELRIDAPIETFGLGARGFNVYSGTVRIAEFDRIVTHGDGAVGIQISQPIGRLFVRRGIETFGGTGDSLVKGVVQKLSAIALSIKPGGSARRIEIHGGLKTNAAGISPFEQNGDVETLMIHGGMRGAEEEADDSRHVH